MSSQQTAQALFERSYDESGAERRATLLSAIELADAENDLDLAFSIRRSYISSCIDDPRRLMMIAHYGWNLARHDEDPERFPISLWEYKWVVGAAPGFSGVSREQLVELGEDLARRFEKAGASSGPAGAAQCSIAAHVGDLDALERHLESWLANPRTGRLNDCSTCDLAKEVYYRIVLGQHDTAIDIADPAIAGGKRCAYQPHGIFSNLLEATRAVGNEELAASLSEQGLALIKSEPRFTSNFGSHLRHFAVTRQLDMGLEVLGRMAPLASGDEDDMLSFTRGARLVLRLADEAGSTEADLAELRERFDGQAEDLAARFDERNGNTHCSGLIAADDAEFEAGWPAAS